MQSDTPSLPFPEEAVPGATSLTLEAKRQVLYAAVLRYTSETGSLRDRVIDRMVLSALADTSADEPLRRLSIRQNIRLGSFTPQIRAAVIDDAITRLIADGMIKRDSRDNPGHYLSDKGRAALRDAFRTGQDVYRDGLEAILGTLDPTEPYELAAGVCRSTLAECFARYGHRIAALTVGYSQDRHQLQAKEISEVFRSLSANSALKSDTLDALELRCHSFFSSRDPRCMRLAFALSQNYFLGHLLGIPDKGFDPLTANAFDGAALYLDTNVVLCRYMPIPGSSEFYRELVMVAKHFGILLYVTTETMAEVGRVVGDKSTKLLAIVKSAPAELLASVADPVVEAYLFAKEADPALTAPAFVEQLAGIPAAIELAGIKIIPIDAERFLSEGDYAHASSAIQAAAIKGRPFAKSEKTLHHDVVHCALVRRCRSATPKTWFLTRDRTLIAAAQDLTGAGELPFALPLIGFLESVSPYFQFCGMEERAGGFLSVLMAQETAARTGGLLSLEEMVILAEHHADIIATPAAKIVEAVGYVKNHILKGQPYDQVGSSTIALELKKRLVSTSAEREKELRGQIEKLETNEALSREIAKRDKETVELRLSETTSKLNELDDRLQSVTRAEAERAREAKEAHSVSDRALFEVVVLRRGRARLVGGGTIAIGVILAWAADYLAYRIVLDFESQSLTAGRMSAGCRIAGSMLIGIGSVMWVRSERWSREVKLAASGLLVAIALWASGVFRSAGLEMVVGYLTVGGVVAILLVHNRGQEKGTEK